MRVINEFKADRFGPVVQHGYVVADVAKTAERWAQQMGVGPFYVVDQRIDDYRYRGIHMPLEFRIAMSYWRNIQLELIQPLSGGQTFYSEALKVAPEKLNHYAVVVRDIDATVKDLQLQRYVIQTGSSPAIRFAYLEGYLPDGMTLELLQATEIALRTFDGVEAICREWNGERLLRTHAELATDLQARRS